MLADELLVSFARRYGNPAGAKAASRAALLVKVAGRPSDWTVEFKSIAPADPPPGGRILTTRAKQMARDEFLTDYCLALNYTPTDWDLGLAWLLKVKYVVYPSGANITAVKTNTDDLKAGGFPAWDLSNWDWNASYDARTGKYTGRQANDVQRIATTYTNAKIIAKMDFDGVTFSKPPAPDVGFIPMPGNAFRTDLLTRAAFALVNQTWKHGGGRDDGLVGHNIGALAVGQDDRILGWAVNVSEVSRCFHAESLLVFRLLVSGINPANVKLRIYCTLEPCQMCSGMITSFFPGAKVYYGMADPKIKSNSLTRKKNGCEQMLSTTCADKGETIPSMLSRLQRQSGLTKNVTGFLDARNASRPAFSGAQDKLTKTPGAISSFHQKIDNRLAGLDLEQGRRAMALLDVRSAPVQSGGSRSLQALDLATSPLPERELQWVGSNWRVHLPFVEYLDKFLGSAMMNKV